jgi:tetratricopeptide (TPR) repeat protein
VSNVQKQYNARQWVDFLALIILVVVVYGSSLGNDFQYSFDDNWYILYNNAVRGVSWHNLRAAFSEFYVSHYLPLVIVSYMLDYTLWGLTPSGYHVTNLAIHAANGLLIYRLFRHWYGDRLFALTGAALFLIHPVQVETVVWISQRKSLLSMFFFLLAWEGYRRYSDAGSGRTRISYAASVAAYAFSLLSKVMTVVFPLILVAYDHCFYPQKRRPWQIDKIPFFLFAAVIVGINIYAENTQNGVGVYQGGSPWATFLTMLTVFCRYLTMLVWPAGLSVIYAPAIHRTVDVGVLAAALVLIGMALLTVLMYRRDRRLGFWVFFFWIGLLPVANIIPMLYLMQDHYLYMPMMGVAALTGSSAVWLRERLGTGRRKLLYLLLGLPLLALSITSLQRIPAWRDDLSLWSDAVAKEPDSFRAWFGYGDALVLSGQKAAARSAYEHSLQLNSDYPNVYESLGDLYSEEGELDKGLALLRKLLEKDPSFVRGWASLGNNYLKSGNYVEAENAFKQALVLQPDAWQVKMFLGDMERVQRNFVRARNYYGQVETRGLDNADNAYFLACVESGAGNSEAALAWLEKALQRGYGDFDKLQTDKQLTLLWNNPRFIYLLQQYDASLLSH